MTRDKRRKGEEKQTERIEVRLGVTLRDRFLAECKRAGDTPSDVLRAAMSSYVEDVELAERRTLRQELTLKLIRNPLKTAAMALTSLAAFTLIAAPSSADERLFKALDGNNDGTLTEADAAIGPEVIDALDANHSRTVTLDEFRTRAVYGYVSVVDPGFEDPEGWSSWSEERQAAYSTERDANVKIIEQTIISLDLSQIGEVQVTKKPILKTVGSPPTPGSFGIDLKKILVEFMPEGTEDTL